MTGIDNTILNKITIVDEFTLEGIFEDILDFIMELYNNMSHIAILDDDEYVYAEGILEDWEAQIYLED